MTRPKITIVGAGNVGATTALFCAMAELGDLVLVDIREGGDFARGKALDMAEAAPLLDFDCALTGTDDYAETVGSDVVVITAGSPRKPGMSRDELLDVNTKTVTSVAEQIRRTSPHAVVIVVTNPLDAMAQRVLQITGFPPNRIVGQAGMLDTARFRALAAMELGTGVEDVTAMLLGGHGDTMVPLARCAAASGIPLCQLISPGQLATIAQRTRDGGAEIVGLLKTSGYYAAGAATMQMVQAVVRDKKRLMPCSAYCDKEYDVGGYYVGVPVILGSAGVERVVEFEMTPDEQACFRDSVDAVKRLVERMGQIETVATPSGSSDG